MSNAEGTEAVTTTPEVTVSTIPNDDLALPEDVAINELPIQIVNPSTEQNESPSNKLNKHEVVGIPKGSDEDGRRPKGDKKQGKETNKMEAKKLQPCPPPQSRCRARSRDMRQCKKHFREMIGKHEIRNDELEQRETDLRQRLEMLDCSMPAVMVWNIWRMAQGAPVSHVREIVEKHFLEPGVGFGTCPSTPSQHWDCRVREVEAERKQALRRAEEARQVFTVKGDALKFQKQEIEEARRLQEERKMEIAKLEEEVKRLQDALRKAQGDENSCETGECGEIQCRKMLLQGISSVSSIHSTDLECLAKLEDLAEAELCMKRQIADLERRECAYMRTLQQADEMWAKMEDDNASNLGDMKDQLDAKIATNQQLADRIVELEDQIEKLRTQLTKATAIVDEYNSKTFADIGLGDSNISTEEKIEQTEDEVKDIQDLDKGKVEDTLVTGEAKFPKTEEIEQLQNAKHVDFTPSEESDQPLLQIQKTEDESSIAKAIRTEVIDPGVEAEQPEHGLMEITTAEESVQVKPEIVEAETQSMPKTPGLEKETSTENRPEVEAATSTEAIGVKEMPAILQIDQKMEMRQLTEEQRGLTIPNEYLKEETEHMDEPVASDNSSRPIKDQASLAHLLKAPTVDKNTGVSLIAKNEDNPNYQEETFPEASEAAVQPTSKKSNTAPDEKSSKTTVKTTSTPADEVVPETTAKPAFKSVAEVFIEVAPEPVVDGWNAAPSEPHIDAPSKPIIETTAMTLPKPLEEVIPKVVDEVDPMVFPMSTIEEPTYLTELVLEPVTKPEIDAAPISPPTPAIEAIERPVLEPTSGGPEPVQIKLLANTLAIPIQTLVSWHNIAACYRKQISTCPQCSPTSREIGEMLDEIRTYLGTDAPDLAKIECTRTREEVQNSVPPTKKKGSCICKPKTCPLEGTPAAVPAQANVQIQTVVDGQSQTLMPVKIPSRETRSSKSSKGSTKSKEEVKLMSIEEDMEPDPGMFRGKSIPEAKDESTVTVGDIASQTETIRNVPPVKSKEENEKLCVCPTGVCPKKTAKSPCGECTLGKPCSSVKKALGKEYKSTADAILAPAIKVRPTNESACSPAIRNTKAEDVNSESSSSACCICGKPVTPVTSRKTTSIPMPTKSIFKSKVPLASESSNDDFLCCTCRAKDSSTTREKHASPDKSSAKSPEGIGRASQHRVKPGIGSTKTSCSREICCSCDKQEIHVLTKTLTADSAVQKSKTRPETKDVCCLAKISRDKSLKSEARRKKDKDSMKSATSSISNCGSGRISSSSSAHKGSKTNDRSDSNVCCSSIEQVTNITRKKGKGNKCACEGQQGKNNEEACVCGEDIEPMVPKHEEKEIKSSVSCVCPPKLFDKS